MWSLPWLRPTRSSPRIPELVSLHTTRRVGKCGGGEGTESKVERQGGGRHSSFPFPIVPGPRTSHSLLPDRRRPPSTHGPSHLRAGGEGSQRRRQRTSPVVVRHVDEVDVPLPPQDDRGFRDEGSRSAGRTGAGWNGSRDSGTRGFSHAHPGS